MTWISLGQYLTDFGLGLNLDFNVKEYNIQKQHFEQASSKLTQFRILSLDISPVSACCGLKRTAKIQNKDRTDQSMSTHKKMCQ